MIKKEIAKELHELHGGMTLAESEQHVNTLLDIMKEAFVAGDPLTITHFGKFKQKKKVVRDVQLPSGKQVMSSAGYRVQFLPSPKLKAKVNAHEEVLQDSE